MENSIKKNTARPSEFRLFYENLHIAGETRAFYYLIANKDDFKLIPEIAEEAQKILLSSQDETDIEYNNKKIGKCGVKGEYLVVSIYGIVMKDDNEVNDNPFILKFDTIVKKKVIFHIQAGTCRYSIVFTGKINPHFDKESSEKKTSSSKGNRSQIVSIFSQQEVKLQKQWNKVVADCQKFDYRQLQKEIKNLNIEIKNEKHHREIQVSLLKEGLKYKQEASLKENALIIKENELLIKEIAFGIEKLERKANEITILRQKNLELCELLKMNDRNKRSNNLIYDYDVLKKENKTLYNQIEVKNNKIISLEKQVDALHKQIDELKNTKIQTKNKFIDESH